MKMCKVLIAALFVVSLPVFATTVTLESQWVVVSVYDTDGVFGGRFQMEGDVSIFTTFESSTPDVDPTVVRGQYDGAITGFTLTSGTAVFSGTGNIVTRNHGPNGYLFGQQTTVTTPSLVTQFSFNSNSDLAQQPSAALEWLVTAPPRIDSSSASLSFEGAAVVLVQVGNYRVAEVPVPGALVLFNTAVAALLVLRRGGVARST
jgi:hypothetical protein